MAPLMVYPSGVIHKKRPRAFHTLPAPPLEGRLCGWPARHGPGLCVGLCSRQALLVSGKIISAPIRSLVWTLSSMRFLSGWRRLILTRPLPHPLSLRPLRPMFLPAAPYTLTRRILPAATPRFCGLLLHARLCAHGALSGRPVSGRRDSRPHPAGVRPGRRLRRAVVIRTRPQAYVKGPERGRRLYTLLFRQYPALAACLNRRHRVYNASVRLCDALVSQGRAVVIAPAAHLEMARFEKDRARLLAACRQGVADGEKALPQIQSLNASGEAV